MLDIDTRRVYLINPAGNGLLPMTNAKQAKTHESPPTPPKPPSIAGALASIAAPLAGDLAGRLFGEFADAYRQAGRAEARAEFVAEAHDRRVREAVAAALADEQAKRAQVGPVVSRSELDTALAKIGDLRDRIASLVDLVVCLIDGEDGPWIPDDEHTLEQVRAFVSDLQGRVLTPEQRDATRVGSFNWSPGGRWEVCDWIRYGRAEGRDMPRILAELVADVTADRASGRDEVDDLETEIRAFERLKPLAPKITPAAVADWSVHERRVALRWAAEHGKRTAPNRNKHAPEHLRAYL